MPISIFSLVCCFLSIGQRNKLGMNLDQYEI